MVTEYFFNFSYLCGKMGKKNCSTWKNIFPRKKFSFPIFQHEKIEKVLQIRGRRPRICNVFEIHFSWPQYPGKIQNYTRTNYSNSERSGQLW